MAAAPPRTRTRTRTPERSGSPTPSQLPPVPASPTYSYASTANPLLAGGYNLPAPPPPRPAHAVLSKDDLEQSQAAYTELVTSAKAYRVALAALSTAASTFGSVLEACARLKEARAEAIGGPASLPAGAGGGGGSCTADLLMAAAGMQQLVANHEQILSETVYRSFEVPLLHELDKWRGVIDDEAEAYAAAVKRQSREIRRLEKEGLKLHRQRWRDVARFRSHLVELTTQLDGLTSLHADHARALLRESQDTSAKIVDASCSLVRAEVDIFESLARKGWTGGGLEDLLEHGTDLFASEEEDRYPGGGAGAQNGGGGGMGGRGGGVGDGSKLFSILPPRSILADSASDNTTRPGHHRADSLLVDNDRYYQSLAGAVSDSSNGGGLPHRGRDLDSVSVFSSTEFNRPRGARPFSPQPIPVLDPDDVMSDSVGRHTPLSDAVAEEREEEEGEGEEHDRGDDEMTPRPPAGFKTVHLDLDLDLRSGGVSDPDHDEQPWRHEGRCESEIGIEDGEAPLPTAGTTTTAPAAAAAAAADEGGDDDAASHAQAQEQGWSVIGDGDTASS